MEATIEHRHLWCGEHLLAPSDDLCGWCGAGYCDECLVDPFGRDRAPYCVRCAVEAAGLRDRCSRRRVRTRADQRALRGRRAHLCELERPPAAPFWLHLPPILDVEAA